MGSRQMSSFTAEHLRSFNMRIHLMTLQESPSRHDRRAPCLEHFGVSHIMEHSGREYAQKNIQQTIKLGDGTWVVTNLSLCFVVFEMFTASEQVSF